MEKKINPKMFSNSLIKWQKEIEQRIVEVMTQQGIKAISLLDNGNDSKSVDSIYVSIINEDDAEKVEEIKVGVIYIENGTNIVIIPENKINLTDVDKISEQGDVFSPKAWDSLYNSIGLYGNYDLIIDEIFSPTKTLMLMSIASTTTEIIENIMKEKPLTDGEVIKIF